MKTALFLALSMLVPAICGAETLKLRSGDDIEGKVLSVDAEAVSLEGGKTVTRKDVAEI